MEKLGPLVALDDLDKNGNLVNLDVDRDGHLMTRYVDEDDHLVELFNVDKDKHL